MPAPAAAPARSQKHSWPVGLADWLACHRPRHRYAFALLAVVIATAIAWLLAEVLDLANLNMVYLLAVLVVAARLGRGPSIATTLLSVLTFVYVFVPHEMSLVLADLSYLPTFLIMLVVGLVVSELTGRLRNEALATAERENVTLALYELSRGLAAAETRTDLAAIAERHVQQGLGCRSWLWERRGEGMAPLGAAAPLSVGDDDAVRHALRDQGAVHTNSLWCQPLVVGNESIGVLACETLRGSLAAADQQLLASFANNIALALHRLIIDEQARSAHERAEDERVRNVMLSSVSHDLRTPLASITGAVTTLIDGGDRLDATTRLDLMQAIREDAEALERQVRNLLDVTRLESGTVQPRRDWHSIEEIVGCALARVEAQLTHHPVSLDVPPDLPLVRLDGLLIEQLLVNLLENAARYSPHDSPVRIAVAVGTDRVELTVTDHGPGIPPGERELVFTKFHRGHGRQPGIDRGPHHGAGLGLPICRAIASLHGGSISIAEVPGGGACFRVRLPAEQMKSSTSPPAEPGPESARA
jgi:two-component system, OmpR family, sensor histidine kinase KdpD